MADGRVNGIVILDAIPTGHLNTARRLSEELRDHTVAGNALGVTYARIANLPDLTAAMLQLRTAVTTKDLRPWLHLEAHGSVDESGFEFADGSHCTWRQLKELVTPLNVATGLNPSPNAAQVLGRELVKAAADARRK